MTSDTLTIRLSPEDRETLATVAEARGEGLSTLVRELAAAEAGRLRAAAVRQQVEQFSALAEKDPQLQHSADPPTPDWPEWTEPLPAAWAAALRHTK